MEGRIDALLSMILVVALCATSLLRPGLAEVQTTPQLPSIPDLTIYLTKCWPSLLKIQGCEIEIFKSVLTGKFENVAPTCCKALTELLDANCWPKMFPLNPLFPPLLKSGCSLVSAFTPGHTTSQLPLIHVDLTKCLSSLVNVEGCVKEIHKSVFTGNFDNVGPMCCKAFSAVDAKCWPQMFALNPFFPPLLKSECSRIRRAAPTHK